MRKVVAARAGHSPSQLPLWDGLAGATASCGGAAEVRGMAGRFSSGRLQCVQPPRSCMALPKENCPVILHRHQTSIEGLVGAKKCLDAYGRAAPESSGGSVGRFSSAGHQCLTHNQCQCAPSCLVSGASPPPSFFSAMPRSRVFPVQLRLAA